MTIDPPNFAHTRESWATAHINDSLHACDTELRSLVWQAGHGLISRGEAVNLSTVVLHATAEKIAHYEARATP